MSAGEFGQWRNMAEAPRDGARVIVAIRASEQGPAEVDVARWARPGRDQDMCWIAADSDHECLIIYDESELACWMPLPSSSEGLRASIQKAGLPEIPADSEMGGSGI
jgi:hypothetical protein